MTDFLERVVTERRADVAAARGRVPERDLIANAERHPVANALGEAGFSAHPSGDAFTAALRQRRQEGRLGVIAEVKRVSPALGVIGDAVDPAFQALQYAAAGATAISVLTEPRHWGGSMADLAAVRRAVKIPVLRKDIVIDEYQLVEARAAGADAVLLIAEALDDVLLHQLVSRALRMGLGVLVEAHEPVAFGRAAATASRVVGVNARDLRDPKVIDLGRARQLHTFARGDQILVAESGIATADDARLLPARVDAVLVGTALMQALDPGPLIRALASIKRTVSV
jgi:indole-3-glycerol phosphate synthase